MTRIIFENLLGWTPVDIALNGDKIVSDFICSKIQAAIGRLMNDEPIQQIFGQADFYGMKLKITPDTLIPRPETAELVDLIVKENSAKDLHVLDAGTGSGCIAIALQRNLPFAQVTAIELSDKALQVAAENAKALHSPVTFLHGDILRLPEIFAGTSNAAVGKLPGAPFDIVVSNPPYIVDSEKASMERNVLDYEPSSALFVPDATPLKFYIPLLEASAAGMSRPGGKIYFEINPLFAQELKQEAVKRGFIDVQLHRDSQGKIRFFSAEVPST